MPKDEFDGLPVIDVPESEGITVVVKSATWTNAIRPIPNSTPLPLRCGGSAASMTRAFQREVLIRRVDQRFRYGAPKRVSLLSDRSGVRLPAHPCACSSRLTLQAPLVGRHSFRWPLWPASLKPSQDICPLATFTHSVRFIGCLKYMHHFGFDCASWLGAHPSFPASLTHCINDQLMLSLSAFLDTSALASNHLCEIELACAKSGAVGDTRSVAFCRLRFP